jgi:hypothetical protein
MIVPPLVEPSTTAAESCHMPAAPPNGGRQLRAAVIWCGSLRLVLGFLMIGQVASRKPQDLPGFGAEMLVHTAVAILVIAALARDDGDIGVALP